MEKVCTGPLQPLAEGVTVILPTAGVVPLLVAGKDPMVPEPEPASPMDVFVFTQG
jgi:hypothetical protein